MFMINTRTKMAFSILNIVNITHLVMLHELLLNDKQIYIFSDEKDMFICLIYSAI
jgi:hypothetical protein